MDLAFTLARLFINASTGVTSVEVLTVTQTDLIITTCKKLKNMDSVELHKLKRILIKNY